MYYFLNKLVKQTLLITSYFLKNIINHWRQNGHLLIHLSTFVN